MIVPTAEQEAILAAAPGPFRISAGAGTGKTTTVAMLVADVVARAGLEPEQILGLTFTNKAAAELADRIRAMTAPVVGTGREAEIHTYHGFAAQIVGEFGPLVGIERGAAVITPTFSRQLLFEVVRHRTFEHFNATWEGSIDLVQRLGAALGDHLVDPRALADAAEPTEPWPQRLELLAVWDDYRLEKARLGVVDYADLISAACRLLDTHADVVERVRSRFGLVLLDEYQDTNPAQRILLQKLFAAGFPLIAVGDPDQTIYEWRGATPSNFEQFVTHFPQASGAPSHSLSLTLNRRSDRLVLDVANRVRQEIGSGTPALTGVDGAGRGEVGVRWLADAVVEAEWIADEITRLHEQGVPWSQMAVLFRKNKTIAQVHDALTAAEIPVEVANLGGLLAVPEITDLRAWMRIIYAPEDGPALLRILMGPRYALGLGDLVHLTRWVDTANREAGADSEIDFDHERLAPHTMLEALDHLEEMEELPARVRDRLLRFRDEFRYLLGFAQGATLAELARTILDRTGAWHDIEAMGEAGRLSARLNVYRFLDLTEEWSPLEGRPSLGAFLDHLRVMEENPADELDAARLSGEEAVALMTIHRAKGLEWDVVFIPAVTKGTFPSQSSGFPNPYLRAQWLPHEYRLDDPPPITAEMTKDEADAILREHHLRQEWRTAYVAVTRARHQLYLSGAYWYGATSPTQRPTPPSDLLELVRTVEGVTDLGIDAEPPRPEILRSPTKAPAPDPVFSEGWAAALRQTIEDPTTPLTLAESLGLHEAVAARVDDYQQRLFDLETVPAQVESERSTSVTGLVTYAACPRRFFWTEVDRLPRRPSPAARRGVEVHRRIELHSLGQVPLALNEADDYDLAAEAGPGSPAGAYTTYLNSPYATRQPLLVEVAFQFPTEAGLAVRGRIDAVYPEAADGWEIVDFKSGRRRDDPWLGVQLEAYAVAVDRVDFGLPRPSRLGVTFAYLGDGLEVVRSDADSTWVKQADEHVEELAEGIVGERFDPVGSTACRSCEFVRFCPTGQAWLSEHPA